MDPPTQRRKKADKAKEKKDRNPYNSKHVRQAQANKTHVAAR
jgi:hypothetical protein